MNSIQLKTFNKLGLTAKKISNHYLSEPYSTLMHYKRAFKFLKGLNHDQTSSALILGNKNQTALKWNEAIRNVDVGGLRPGKVNSVLIATAPTVYSLIICLDPVLFARCLRNCPLPILGVATALEIHEYPEILSIIDYLVPASTRRSDVTIRDLLWKELIQDNKKNTSDD